MLEARRKETGEELTVDPFRVRVDEEGNDSGNVGGDCAATEWAEGGDAGLDLFHGSVLGGARRVVPRVLREHVGLDAAGGDPIDGHLLVAGVGGEGSNEPFDGSLGARVQGVVLDAGHLGRDRRHEDDPAAGCVDGSVSRHSRAGFELTLTVLESVLGHEELGTGVQAEYSVVQLLGHILLGRKGLGTSIVDDNVESTEMLQRFLEQFGDLRHLGHVGLDGHRPAAHLLDVGHGCQGGLGAAGVVHDHGGTSAGQMNGQSSTETSTGTSD